MTRGGIVLALILVLVTPALAGPGAPAATAATPATTESFAAVDYVNAGALWAVGTPGAACLSTNGGVSWSRRPLGNNDWVTGLEFLTRKRGWVISVANEGEPGRIWFTQDAGRHWTQQANPTSTDVFTGIAFAGTHTGVIVGRYGTILRTATGGATWTKVPSGTTAGLSAVAFVGKGVGYACGTGGLILKTVDAGATWLPLPTGTARDLRAVCGVGKRVWAVGVNGLVLRSTDGGTKWRASYQGKKLVLADVDFVDRLRGWAVGSGGTILRTRDGGVTWKKQKSGTKAFLSSVAFVTTKRGCVAGELMRPADSTPWAIGVLRYTKNGGQSWRKGL